MVLVSQIEKWAGIWEILKRLNTVALVIHYSLSLKITQHSFGLSFLTPQLYLVVFNFITKCRLISSPFNLVAI